MKKTIKFFSRTPTAVNSKSHSAVQTTDEYTEEVANPTPAVAQQSESVDGLKDLAAKVSALTSIVEKLVVNQGVAATMPKPTEEVAAVAQNSATVEGAAEAAKTVDALAPEADKAVNQPLDAEKPNAEAETAAVAQASTEGTEGADTGDEEKPEGIPEGNLGAETPANTGVYTDVPEDDIVKQFSKTAGMEVAQAQELGLAGKESFSVLFQ